jgi:hypothetical protein
VERDSADVISARGNLIDRGHGIDMLNLFQATMTEQNPLPSRTELKRWWD